MKSKAFSIQLFLCISLITLLPIFTLPIFTLPMFTLPISAQESPQLKNDQPNTLVELFQIRQQLINELGTPGIQNSGAIAKRKAVAEIENTSIERLKSGDKEFLAGAGNVTADDFVPIIQAESLKNQYALFQLYQGEKLYSESVDSIQQTIALSAIINGDKNWMTREYELKLGVARWLETADENDRDKFFSAKAAAAVASSAFQNQEFENGGKAFQETIAMLEELGLQKSMEYGEAVANFPELVVAAEKLDEAEPLFERAIKVNDELFLKQSPVNANMRRSLAELYRNTKRPAEAINILEEAEAIYKIVHDPGSIDWAYSLYLQSLNQTSLDKIPEATQTCFTAYTMMQDIGLENSPLFPELHKQVYALYQILMQPSKEIGDAPNSVNIGESVFGDDKNNFARWLVLLGDIERSKGQNDTALLNFVNAREKFEQLDGPDQVERYIDCLSKIAMTNHALGKNDTAVEVALVAADLAREKAGDQSMFYAIRAQNLAYLYTVTGEHEKAEAIFAELIPSLQNVLGENNIEFLRVMNDRAENFHRGKKYAEAIEQWTHLKALQEKQGSVEKAEIVRTLQSLIRANEMQGNTPEIDRLKIELEKLGG